MNAILNHGANGTATTGSVLTNSDAIAIYGGDARTSRLGWPKGYNIRFFQATKFGGNGETERLVSMLRGRRIGTLILLTKFMSHSDSDTLRRVGRTYANRLIMWTKGPGELSRELADMVPAPQVVAVPVPKIEAVRQVEAEKEPTLAKNKKKHTRHVFTEEQIEEMKALSRKGVLQKEIGRRFGIVQSAVSYLVRGGRKANAVKKGAGPTARVAKVIAPAVEKKIEAPIVDDRPPVIVAIEAMRAEWRALSDALIDSVSTMKKEIDSLTESNRSLAATLAGMKTKGI